MADEIITYGMTFWLFRLFFAVSSSSSSFSWTSAWPKRGPVFSTITPQISPWSWILKRSDPIRKLIITRPRIRSTLSRPTRRGKIDRGRYTPRGRRAVPSCPRGTFRHPCWTRLLSPMGHQPCPRYILSTSIIIRSTRTHHKHLQHRREVQIHFSQDRRNLQGNSLISWTNRSNFFKIVSTGFTTSSSINSNKKSMMIIDSLR